MTSTAAQRVITLTLTGTGNELAVTYSYFTQDPQEFHIQVPTCELVNKVATNCLFALDYASAQAGWTISGTTPNPGDAPALKYQLGPSNQSVQTIDGCTHQATYKFYIDYLNTVTREVASFDPQEQNVPGPG